VKLVAALALAVLVPAAAAGSRIVAPGPVSALAFDGARVAFASGRSPGDCDRVRIWSPRTGAVVRVGRSTPCVTTSTGTGIAALSLAGSRVLWLHYTGGNIREWSLFTATVGAPRPRRLAFAARDVDAPAPIVVGEGDSRAGGLLPYAVDREVIALRADGTRMFSWAAPARVTALGARGQVLAVGLADGSIVVHDLAHGTSSELLESGPPTAVFVTGAGVAAQIGRTAVFSGRATYSATLPRGAVVRDADGLRALYTASGRVEEIDFASGTTRDLGAGGLAQLEGAHVATAGGRVVRVAAR
jgi:hypothetical protein